MSSNKNDKLKVLIEIPEGSRVKYELNEETGELFIDRFMPTMMGYPMNYGLIEETAGEDGDALDALVFASGPISPGTYIYCKIIGVLEMEDEAGIDHKIAMVPATTKIDPICGAWSSLDDIPEARKAQIKHFFEHYKDLEKDKWVKLNGWSDVAKANKILAAGQERFLKEMAADLAECDCESGCAGCQGACAASK